MPLVVVDCDNVSIYLTEYSRNQLPSDEMEEISEHLNNCNNCRIENEIFKSMSVEIDKLIPAVTKAYEKSLIYKLFIKSQNENILVKFLSFLLIVALISFITSSFFSPKYTYISLKDLQFRAENIFKESFYSGMSKDAN